MAAFRRGCDPGDCANRIAASSDSIVTIEAADGILDRAFCKDERTGSTAFNPKWLGRRALLRREQRNLPLPGSKKFLGKFWRLEGSLAPSHLRIGVV
jgi:hypothetical protein